MRLLQSPPCDLRRDRVPIGRSRTPTTPCHVLEPPARGTMRGVDPFVAAGRELVGRPLGSPARAGGYRGSFRKAHPRAWDK